MKKNIKLPTILGVFVLVMGLIAGIYLINSKQVFRLGAQVENLPKNVTIGNITNDSITITWTTDVKSKGFVKWGNTNKNLNKIANEESSDPDNVHLTVISGIEKGTDIFFIINSNGTDFFNNDIPWQTKTLVNKIASTLSVTGTGMILAQDGNLPVRAVVNLMINGTILSTTTSKEGSWVIPITNYIDFLSDSTIIEINVNSGPNGVAQAIIYPMAIKSTPIILLGKTYDFRTIQNSENSNLPESNFSIPESVEKSSRFEIDKPTATGSEPPVTLDSIDEGEIINTNDPEFFGTGPSDSAIIITVESELQSQTVSANKNGNWAWSPPNNLEPGEHTITIKWYDANGIARTLTRNFVVSAAEGPAFESTPSATPVLTSTPVATSTPRTTPTIISSSSPLPVTGDLTGTLGLFMMGLGLLLSGFFVYQKSYAKA